MDKKKYGILTFHRAINYGAILQAYAMQKTLEKYELDVEIIDYRAEFNEKRFGPKKIKDISKCTTFVCVKNQLNNIFV